VAWAEIAGPTERGPFIAQVWQVDLLRRLQTVSEAVAAGKPVRVDVEAPTQVGKSEAVKRWLSWHLATVGSVGFGSYELGLAEEHSTAIRAMLRSEIAQEVWPHLKRKIKREVDETTGEPIRDSAKDWAIPSRDFRSRRPTRFVARGRKGGLAGRYLPLVVADDLLKDESEYMSEAFRNEADRWVRSQAELRVQENNGSIVFIGSRWGNDDPQARRRSRDPSVKVWSYPLVVRPGITPPDALNREPGVYLTSQWDEEKERQARVRLTPRLARAVLDCAPEGAGGGLWKAEHFSKRYHISPESRAKQCSRTWLTLDGAETAGDGDWSVITWWGEDGGRFPKLGQWRQQVEFPELLALARDIHAKVRPHAFYVEKKSSGKQVYQTLVREIPGVVGVSPSTSKRDRWNAALPTMQTSCEYPADAPWMLDYVDRMTSLIGEGDEVDDEADADTMGINATLGGSAKIDARKVLQAVLGGKVAAVGGRR
jgi:predicted phage terminase large subunit-like protein